MENDPAPFIEALRHSQDSLRALVAPLTDDQLEQVSYCPGWSIAQVLSHLGSQAEIFGLWLDAGLSGQDPPGQDAISAIWDAWNARAPRAQAADSLQANEAFVRRLESLDAGQRERFHLRRTAPVHLRRQRRHGDRGHRRHAFQGTADPPGCGHRRV